MSCHENLPRGRLLTLLLSVLLLFLVSSSLSVAVVRRAATAVVMAVTAWVASALAASRSRSVVAATAAATVDTKARNQRTSGSALLMGTTTTVICRSLQSTITRSVHTTLSTPSSSSASVLARAESLFQKTKQLDPHFQATIPTGHSSSQSISSSWNSRASAKKPCLRRADALQRTSLFCGSAA
jgi:hypothetical protein